MPDRKTSKRVARIAAKNLKSPNKEIRTLAGTAVAQSRGKTLSISLRVYFVLCNPEGTKDYLALGCWFTKKDAEIFRTSCLKEASRAKEYHAFKTVVVDIPCE